MDIFQSSTTNVISLRDTLYTYNYDIYYLRLVFARPRPSRSAVTTEICVIIIIVMTLCSTGFSTVTVHNYKNNDSVYGLDDLLHHTR